MPPRDLPVDPKAIKALYDAQLDAAKRVAELAHSLRCEITIGEITVRPCPAPVPRPSAAAETQAYIACFLQPLQAFIDALAKTSSVPTKS